MDLETYNKAEPAGVVTFGNGEQVRIGFFLEGGRTRFSHIFTVESAPGRWLTFDSRKVPELSKALDGVSLADGPRMKALGAAIGNAFSGREQLAWALCGAVDGVVASNESH